VIRLCANAHESEITDCRARNARISLCSINTPFTHVPYAKRRVPERDVMTQAQEVWWRPGGRSPFALDPNKPFWPQIGSAIGQALIIFGGPAIGLLTITSDR
jgi:hypothetical protein